MVRARQLHAAFYTTLHLLMLLIWKAYARNPNYSPTSFCQARYADAFLPIIHEELMPWAGHGIDETLIDQAFRDRTYHNAMPGIPFVFRDGVPYVVGNSSADALLPWHRDGLMTYCHIMVHLSKLFGRHIPDVEFVIMADDEPGEVIDRMHMPPIPTFR